MGRLSKNKGGFTLVEILVSVGILMIFLPFAASMLTNSRILGSYAKHKTQAAFAAQQVMEAQRQSAFVVLAPGTSQVTGPTNIILDTKGSYINLNCATNPNLFCGTTTTVITPTVYTNAAGTRTTSSTTDHVVVQIFWSERINKFFIPMTETYAEDIINDPMLN